MAKYAFDRFDRFDDFVINRNTNTIYIKHPMSALDFHRKICDVYDEIEFMVYSQPTMRVTDEQIIVKREWTVENMHYCSGQLVNNT